MDFILEFGLKREINVNKSQQHVRILISQMRYVEDVTLATNWMFLENVLKRILKILTLAVVNLIVKGVALSVLSDFTLAMMADALQFLQNVPISISLKDTVKSVIQDID